MKFWSDPQSAEVDWVIVKSKKYLPIEVKLKNSPTIDDCVHLLKFLAEYDCPFGAFIVCDTLQPMRLAKNIQAISWREISSLVDLIDV